MAAILAVIVIIAGYVTYRGLNPENDVVVSDNLDNNILPSLILSTATTDTVIVAPVDSLWAGTRIETGT